MAKILIVDDEFAILESIADLLVDEGHAVKTATNAHTALIEAAQFNPEMIVTDQMMPGMNGLTMIAELRKTPAFATIPVVLMTALPKNQTGTPPAGVTVLHKPFQIDDLLSLLEKLHPKK